MATRKTSDAERRAELTRRRADRAIARELSRGADGRISFGPPIALGAGAPAMYPVLAPASSGFAAVWTAGAGDGSTIGFDTIR